ncbi:hypothetical protein MUP77_17700 [Candidatus Bathyarchaeota archaeon]|nr:hypothetical protein [Candidatus Bathyarchaeota archaeon]
MKITVSLESIPIKVEIEGSDDSMATMVDVASETLFRLRKIWLDTIKRQTKLKPDEEKKIE